LNAVMRQTFGAYQVVNSLGGRDDQNSTRFSLNFRHVALAYQRYCEDSHLLAEDQHERQRRLKACTEIIGAVVSQVLSDFKASGQMPDSAIITMLFSRRSTSVVSECCQQHFFWSVSFL